MTAFSISEFRAFCESKPADEPYDYMDCDACPMARFHEARGSQYCLREILQRSELDSERRAEAAASAWPETYGDLAERLRELEAAS